MSGSARDTTRGSAETGLAEPSPPESPGAPAARPPAHARARRAAHASDVASPDAKPSRGTPLPPVHPRGPATRTRRTRRTPAKPGGSPSAAAAERAARGATPPRASGRARRAWGCGGAEDRYVAAKSRFSTDAGKTSRRERPSSATDFASGDATSRGVRDLKRTDVKHFFLVQ